MIQLLSMTGVAQKIFRGFLFLSLLFSVSHFCVEQIELHDSKVKISKDANGAYDVDADAESSHFCHLGCCPVVSYAPHTISFSFETLMFSTEEAQLSNSSSTPPLFKPPIA